MWIRPSAFEDACVLQELEKENAQLKKVVADQARDISILKVGGSGKF